MSIIKKPYTKTLVKKSLFPESESTWFEVNGPGLTTPRRYPTERIADEAIALFEAIYKAGAKENEP
jgi:hypothetical protein